MAHHPLNDVVLHLRRAVQPVCDEQTDAELIGAFVQQKDAAALAALVRRHGPLVWGVCQRVLRHPQEAEDAFQATFLLLVRRAGTIREKAKVAHWLYRVAHQTALRARAIAARRAVREKQVTEMPEPAQAEHDFWSDLQPLLDQELNRLPDPYGVVIVLCDLEGKTRLEVAQQLGWPEGTVAGRLARARALLAKRLARHGLLLSAATLATMLPQIASASVPTAVLSSTIRAATLLAAGRAITPAVISMKVATLTDGVLRAMFLTKLKMGMSLLLVVALGLGLLMHSALAQRQPGVEGEDRGEEKKPEADRGAPVPEAEEPKERASFAGHSAQVTSVAFSPDGKTLASGGLEGTVKLWEVATGKERASFKGYPQVAFSPDGKTLATGSRDYTVKVWDLTTGKERTSLQGHRYHVLSVAFSPDGKILASAGGDRTVKLWDVATGKERASLEGHTSGILSVAFSPDGKTLASGSDDQTVKLWDVATGKERTSLEGHTGGIHTVAFGPDGKTLASGSADKTVKLWSLTTGEERLTLQGHTEIVRSLAFRPDGKILASGSDDQTVRLWETATGKERACIQGQTRSVFALAFSPDGKILASGRDDHMVKLWEIPGVQKTER